MFTKKLVYLLFSPLSYYNLFTVQMSNGAKSDSSGLDRSLSGLDLNSAQGN